MESAGAAIDGLGAQPQTAAVADTAREAKAHGVSPGGYLTAGLLVVGLVATLFVSPTRQPEPVEEVGETPIR